MAANPLFDIEIGRTGEVLVVRLRGELDRVFTPEVDRRLQAGLGEAQAVVVVLRDVTYIDMGGIKVLEEEARRMRARGRRFVAADPPPMVRRVLEIVGFEQTVPVLPTLEDALAYLAHPPDDGKDAGPSGAPVGPADGEKQE